MLVVLLPVTCMLPRYTLQKCYGYCNQYKLCVYSHSHQALSTEYVMYNVYMIFAKGY